MAQASQRQVHQRSAGASDPVIPTSNRVELPRLSNDDPEHISVCDNDPGHRNSRDNFVGL